MHEWNAGTPGTVTVVGLAEGGGGELSGCNSQDLSMLLRLQGPEALAEVCLLALVIGGPLSSSFSLPASAARCFSFPTVELKTRLFSPSIGSPSIRPPPQEDTKLLFHYLFVTRSLCAGLYRRHPSCWCDGHIEGRHACAGEVRVDCAVPAVASRGLRSGRDPAQLERRPRGTPVAVSGFTRAPVAHVCAWSRLTTSGACQLTSGNASILGVHYSFH